MEKRDFGNGNVSLLGFGLMRLPCTTSHADIDRKTAGEMIDTAIAGGINYFDTAYMYHEGQSENFAGEALSRYERQSFYLADKMPIMQIQSAADVERIFNEQLKKCRTPYFDFYLLHGIQGHLVKITQDCRVYEQLLKKKEAGLIRHLGFSFHDRPELLRKIIGEHKYDFVQIQLNYLDWELQNSSGQYKILADANIPVHVMEPVRGGALAALCDESVRIFKEADSNASPASWALRFAASLPGVQVVLSGMSTLEQVKDNIKTFSPFMPLGDAERIVIDAALDAYRKTAPVPCTACRYCMDCPSGVEIPKNLAIYNNYARKLAEKNPSAEFLFKLEYGLLKPEERAASCEACGQCAELCPQHIDIPRWMKEITEKQSGGK